MKKTRLGRLLIEAGLLIASERRTRSRYLVLTAPAAGIDPAGLRTIWNRMRGRLADGGHYESYAATIEVANDRPHVNLILVGGKSIPRNRLSEMSRKSGFGENVWIQRVRDTERDAFKLASYVVKGAAHAVQWAKSHGASRHRPIRLSKGWQPYGLTEGRRHLREASGLPTLEGPFIRVRGGDGRKPTVLGPVNDPHDQLVGDLRS